jgi:hypothetical protein
MMGYLANNMDIFNLPRDLGETTGETLIALPLSGLGAGQPSVSPLDLVDLRTLAAEAMGWQPLGLCAYLHLGAPEGEDGVIHVVGVPDLTQDGFNVLLLSG